MGSRGRHVASNNRGIENGPMMMHNRENKEQKQQEQQQLHAHDPFAATPTAEVDDTEESGSGIGLEQCLVSGVIRGKASEGMEMTSKSFQKQATGFVEFVKAMKAGNVDGDMAERAGFFLGVCLSENPSLIDDLMDTNELCVEIASKKRNFLLERVQPACNGFMDGLMSLGVVVFYSVAVTNDIDAATRISVVAALMAAISMGFSEATTDDGRITGRGGRVIRGVLTGIGAFLGAVASTIPYVLVHYETAITVSFGVILIQLYVLIRVLVTYMEMPTISTTVTVVGALLVNIGLAIGGAHL